MSYIINSCFSTNCNFEAQIDRENKNITHISLVPCCFWAQIHLLLCVCSVSGNLYHALPHPKTLLQKLPPFHALQVSLIIDSGSEPQLISAQFLGTHFVFKLHELNYTTQYLDYSSFKCHT